jgi:hypothetical protein
LLLGITGVRIILYEVDNIVRKITTRNSDLSDVSGIVDPLTSEGLIFKYESQDNFNKTEARSVPAFRKFNLRFIVDQLVVTLIRLG